MTNVIQPQNSRVLVVDDEDVVHASLRKILSRLGYGVQGVLSARDALDRLESESFDLVITDLMMPEMNGVELLTELRSRGCSTPILMVTGYPTIRTAVQALRLGAVDYVAKPFTRKELLSPVKRALRIEDDRCGEPTEAPTIRELTPGNVLFLPHHAWTRFEQDGTFSVGVEASFLGATGTVTAITPAEEIELVEQGFVGFVMTSEEGDAHGVAMPLSGRVVSVNEDAFSNVERIDASTWLIRVLPSQLADELPMLIPRD